MNHPGLCCPKCGRVGVAVRSFVKRRVLWNRDTVRFVVRKCTACVMEVVPFRFEGEEEQKPVRVGTVWQHRI